MSEAYSVLRQPLVDGKKSLERVTEDVAAPMERRASPLWWAALAVSIAFLALGAVAIAYQVKTRKIGRAHV